MKLFQAVSRKAYLNADIFQEFYTEKVLVKGKEIFRIIGLEKEYEIKKGSKDYNAIVLGEYDTEESMNVAFNSFIRFLSDYEDKSPFQF